MLIARSTLPGNASTEASISPTNSSNSKIRTSVVSDRSPAAIQFSGRSEVAAPAPLLHQAVANMTTPELLNYCRKTESDFRAQNLHAHVVSNYSNDEDAARKLQTWMDHALRRARNLSGYYEGQISTSSDSETLVLALYLSIEPSDHEQKSGRRPECTNYVVAGRLDGGSPFIISQGGTCGYYSRSGDHFYFDLELYREDHVQKFFNFVLVPMPITQDPPLQYQLANSSRWIKDDRFRWKPIDKASFDDSLQKLYQASQ